MVQNGCGEKKNQNDSQQVLLMKYLWQKRHDSFRKRKEGVFLFITCNSFPTLQSSENPLGFELSDTMTIEKYDCR